MRHFLQELGDLQNRLLEMGGLVESSIHESVLALTERRVRRTDSVWSNETRINRLEIEIDELATRLLALQQPIAGDLRFITAAIKINTDLERMGDLAVNIAQRALALIEKPAPKAPADIRRMAMLTQEMVRKCLDAFVQRDPDLAREVLLSDDEVDRLRTSMYRESIEFMKQDPATIAEGVDLILISRHLERIADHATNIAEDTLFLVKGVDVRHHAEA
ncbi:MAG: phosphate signaling complex protein PhoU [Candidatus Acidiferrales bacterium]